jgi:hypothetical protein
MHELSDRITQLTGCVDTSLAAIFQKVLLELEGNLLVNTHRRLAKGKLTRYPSPSTRTSTKGLRS